MAPKGKNKASPAKPALSTRTLELRRRERLVRARAKYVLGSVETARDWMATPNKALGGKSPMQKTRSKAGTEAVLEVLGRVLHDLYS